MTRNEIIQDQLEKSTGVLDKKNKEYVKLKPKKVTKQQKRQLDYYREIATFMGITPQQALAGQMSKHTKSIYDMIQTGQDFDMEIWEEKITDHINYLLMLKIILVEEAQETIITE